MSKTLLNLFIIIVIFAGSYFWYVAKAVCPIPIQYDLGQFDTEFGITKLEALSAISEAEFMWEDATGLNLFSLKEGGMPINFIFDERQQFTDTAETLGEKLDRERRENEGLEDEYKKIVAMYDSASAEYDSKVRTYEAKLFAYNNEVASWNEKGGAPQEVYEELNAQQRALDVEQEEIEVLRRNLNNLAAEINELTDQTNEAIEAYNEEVSRYNEAFSEGAEFTQGDYQGDKIHIYQFSNHEELVLVLAHEFGHALGIDHVANEESIMFMRMHAQSTELGLSQEDMHDFAQVCGDGSFWFKLTSLKIW